MLQFDYGDSVWEGGFCPICKIYWGGFCPSQQKRVGGILSGGDFVLHSFVPQPLNLEFDTPTTRPS